MAPTARMLRQRIRAVLEWAVAMDLRPDNPYEWIVPVFGAQGNAVRHMRALPHAEVAFALRTVQVSKARPVLKLAFKLMVLTAKRSREVRRVVYVGSLTFFRLDNSVWSPYVNRSSRSSGEYEIEIRAEETVTLRLTDPQLESGAAVLLSDYVRLDNLIEANLTYLNRNVGQISDRVGIAPSNEFHRACIPFEQFAETDLASAHV